MSTGDMDPSTAPAGSGDQRRPAHPTRRRGPDGQGPDAAGVRRDHDRRSRTRRFQVRVRRYGSGDNRRGSAEARTSAINAIATVGSPIAVLTALLVYFGWVRTNIQAHELGYDVSIVDMSIQDYVLKSVNVLYVPLILMVLAAIVLRSLHHHVIVPRLARRWDRRRLGRWLGLLTFSWVMWLAVCILLLLSGPPFDRFAVPATLTAALLCVLYAAVLRRRLHTGRPPSTGVRALVAVLLALAVFWDTERVARMMGEAYAAEIVAAPEKLVAVTIFSPKDLALSGPGIVVARVGSPESAYSYRYEGFRLLQRSGSRYLLIGQAEDPTRSRVFVIQEAETIRLEFSR